jgi:hypothetical protein
VAPRTESFNPAAVDKVTLTKSEVLLLRLPRPLVLADFTSYADYQELRLQIKRLRMNRLHRYRPGANGSGGGLWFGRQGMESVLFWGAPSETERLGQVM